MQSGNNWIFIIQSLNDTTKLKTGCGIFKDLKIWCDDFGTGIIPKYYEVSTKKDLEERINDILSLIREDDSLILHIESHGNYDGIGLVNEGIDWDSFWKLVYPLSSKINSRVVYILSMCRSKFSTLSFCYSQEMMPFQYLIASNDVVNAGPACLALKEFYKEYINSRDIIRSFEKLKSDYISHDNDNPFLLLSPQDVIRMRGSIMFDYERVRHEQ